MIADPEASQRRELGQFLRAQREKLAPAAAGVPAGPRRRTPGLRREEVAGLAGLSPTWYSWIEQGREVSVSPGALGRLAKVLQLTRAERAYLFDLAGKRDPAGPGGDPPADPPPTIAALLAAIAAPAYLLDRRWTALAWNRPAARLFAGWLDGPGGDGAAGRNSGRERNLLRYIFLDPSAPALICGWEDRARRVLAEFRAGYSRQMNDPALRRLVEELGRGSPLFARAWEEHEVLGREGGERSFRHPQDGFLRYRQETFIPAERPELKLVVLLPETADGPGG